MRFIQYIILLLIIGMTGCGVDTDLETDTEVKPQNDVNQVDDAGLLSPNRVLNIAHRGASGHAPEHTLASYETGEEMIGDYIEIDLQMTLDGELIAMHDSDVSRTTDGLGLVKELTLEEIKVLDAGTWFNDENLDLAQPAFSNLKIPTLDEIIEMFGTDANYYIETKTPEEYPNMVKKLVVILKAHELIGPDVPKGKVIIQSFSRESLLEAKKLEPAIPLIQLISYKDTAMISEAELNKIKEYAIGIGANFKYLNEDYISKVREAGLLLHPYTVNETEDMKQLIDWGVSGMFTDYPDRLHEVLEEINDR